MAQSVHGSRLTANVTTNNSIGPYERICGIVHTFFLKRLVHELLFGSVQIQRRAI